MKRYLVELGQNTMAGTVVILLVLLLSDTAVRDCIMPAGIGYAAHALGYWGIRYWITGERNDRTAQSCRTAQVRR